MPAPPPLTEQQKKIYSIALGIGIVILAIGLYLALVKNSDSLFVFAMLGGGGALVGISAMMLFFRPDK